ncbi:putative transcription regulator, containing CBS domains [Candidatus Nitrososphaera gargensis Ga9.2]|uniref:Putative transcription regulator, containing CBS domains n=1 Tax=Nitrososphaera gargensis (strain Ga9.2) TaxID=1237085 RepID=K0IG11_NITGG|nr:CBS domain-containing protein [Candidatus Nitrososphaera gargensis]AFU57743.1 putative transcription regulator, containing CBS domains [Candidatus Nitrososphaera gargensis Ga9.2]
MPVQLPTLASIRKRRLALGMTQQQFAQVCRLSQSMIAKIENSRTDPSYSTAIKIFETLERLEAQEINRIPRLITAKDIMTKKLISAAPTDLLFKAALVMLENNISQMPVLSREAATDIVVGGLTERLLLTAWNGDSNFKGKKVSDIMSEPFPIIGQDTTISTIRNILTDEPAVLVSDSASKRIVGIITKQDLIKVTARVRGFAA